MKIKTLESLKKKKKETSILRECLDAVNLLPGVFIWRQNSAKVLLRNKDGSYRMIHTGTVGCGDAIGLVWGFHVELETKRPGEKQSAEQMAHEATIKRLGGYYFVVHSAAEAMECLQPLSEKLRRWQLDG